MDTPVFIAMKQQIIKLIAELENEKGIRILYACESGSRAWGFASPDSDYDIRFIYAHPREWYLKLEETKDTIDAMLPNNPDLGGWDLSKALRLFSNCNLELNEWLGSPEVYHSNDSFKDELLHLVPNYFNPRKAVHHYLSMAAKTWDQNLDDDSIKIKKLFYVLRPLSACLWIQEFKSMPPTSFHEILAKNLFPTEIREITEQILKEKETAPEGFLIQVPHTLKTWINTTLQQIEQHTQELPACDNKPWKPLNAFFQKWL